MPQLPSPLRLTPSFPFVGRPRELALLRTLLPRADSESRRIVLIGGEPGSGKSRLVREFAAEAVDGGAQVLYGACDAVVRTPYQPFAEALGGLVRDADRGELRADLGSGAGELTRLLPELGAYLGDLPDPLPGDQDAERLRLHVAVADLLVNSSRRRPVLLVVEDGHWADTPTLLLLRHLSRAAADARMLILATFRDTEADVPAELSEALVDLRRSEGLVRLRVTGLNGEEVAEFLARAADGELGPELRPLAASITDLTSGNAFLVTELWRMLVETGAVETVMGVVHLTRPVEDLGSPESVREVVGQRLARLDATTTEVLELAAVAGPVFDFDVIRRAGALEPAALAGALDQATRSGMIEEIAGLELSYRFSHELVRRALYDRASAVRRAELHLRVGEALEDGGRQRTSRSLADLAHHFTLAAPIGGTSRAITYNLAAARAALAALAFDEAVDRFTTALDLGVDDPTERAALLIELGTACFRGGRGTDSLEAFRRAADTARSVGDGELFARAAIGFENSCWRSGGVDSEGAVDLVGEAWETLGGGESGLHVMVLAALARARVYAGDHVGGVAARDSAIAMARRIDDRPGLAAVLIRAYWSRGLTSVEEILAMLTEARELSAELGDRELEAEALEWRITTQIALCNMDTARADLAAALTIARDLRQPFIHHVAEQYASTIALCDGYLGEAETAAHRSREWGRLLTGRDASGVHGIQMFGIRREQGRLAELAPAVRVLARGGGGAWRPGLVALLAELGMDDEVRAELAGLRLRGLDELRESLWTASLSYLTDACAAVGDADTAALLYPELEPLAGSSVMIAHGVACYGAADRYLGMLASACGERETARGHFERALSLNRRMGARTFLAHTAYEYARLLRLGDPDDRRRATQLLNEGAALAAEIAMPALLARIEGLGAPGEASRLPDGLSAREAEVLRLVARGLSNREIGAALHISEHTAANHVRSLLRKTGSANRTEVASYAHVRGIVRERPSL